MSSLGGEAEGGFSVEFGARVCAEVEQVTDSVAEGGVVVVIGLVGVYGSAAAEEEGC
jgi:hypothetical protein